MSSKGIGGHHRAYRGKTDEWLTPPEILTALGKFDLDPCAPRERPWPTAKCHYTSEVDGLQQEWFGRVWLNPPYGPETGKWLRRLVNHGNGIALIFARTETEMFHDWCWPSAQGMLFLKGRLHFYTVKGKRAKANAGGPSVLVAYGLDNARCLYHCSLPGKFVRP